MKKTLLLCGFLSCFLTLAIQDGYAQEYTEEPAISAMMEEFVRFNRENPMIQGWRIQILATTERRQMERIRSRFDLLYPDYTLDFEHQNPYYMLKTGAFLSRMDALPLLKKLQKEFPSAFLVSDEIELAEVLENPKE